MAGAQVFPVLQAGVCAAVNRNGVLIAQSEIEREIGTDLPVVLDVAAQVVPDLADEARGFDSAAARVTEEERGKSIAGVLRSVTGDRRGLVGEAAAAVGPVLSAAVPAVVRVEKSTLEYMGATDECSVVRQREVSTAIDAPRRSAPSAVSGEGNGRQCAIRTWSVRNLQLLVPLVIGIDGVGGREPLAFLQIADAERVDDAGAKGVVPGAAAGGAAIQVDARSVEWDGKSHRPVGAELVLELPLEEEEGDAVGRPELVVQLHAPLVPRVDHRPFGAA